MKINRIRFVVIWVFLGSVLSFLYLNCGKSPGTNFSDIPSILRTDESVAIKTDLFNVVLYEGQDLNMQFTYESKIVPEIIWYKDGEVIEGQSSTLLDVKSLSASDAGIYFATMVYKDKNVAQTKFAKVEVNQLPSSGGIAPQFTLQPASLSVVEGESINLVGYATGVPQPSLQWKKDGQDLVGQTSTVFSITSAKLSDAGNYSLVASNQEGMALSQVAVVTVQPIESGGPDNGTGTGNSTFNPKITSFNWSPNPIQVGVGSTISWSTTGVTGCTGNILIDGKNTNISGTSGSHHIDSSDSFQLGNAYITCNGPDYGTSQIYFAAATLIVKNQNSSAIPCNEDLFSHPLFLLINQKSMGYFVRFTEKGSQHYFEFDHDLDHLVLEGLAYDESFIIRRSSNGGEVYPGLGENKIIFERPASDFEISYQVSYVLVRDKITSNIFKIRSMYGIAAKNTLLFSDGKSTDIITNIEKKGYNLGPIELVPDMPYRSAADFITNSGSPPNLNPPKIVNPAPFAKCEVQKAFLEQN